MGVITTHTEVVDDKTYTCKTFPASEALVILPKLIALLGEEVANLVFGTSGEQLEKLMGNRKVITKMLIRISERAADTDGLLLLKDLMKYTECDKVKVGDTELQASVHERFDTHFAADYAHLFKVVAWVARASFANP